MIIQIIRFVFIVLGAVGGYQFALDIGIPGLNINESSAIILQMILGAGVGYVGGGIVGRRVTKTLAWIEDSLRKVPIVELIFGVIGLISGLVTAFLVTLPLAAVGIASVRLVLTIAVYLLFSWLGWSVGSGRRDEILSLFGIKEAATGRFFGTQSVPDKLIDTNIIIDGRIIDIVRAGFIEGRLNLPRFVLQELHLVADSADSLKRNRGRRGLELLGKLQTEFESRIIITETDFPGVVGVDAKLIRLAQETGAVILTNDFNLNKVAQLEGVGVLNLNDLTNALKAVVLPGEHMGIKIIRQGKEEGQGIGYLEDGTMVVVENGRDRIGEIVDLEVTSVLQTSAGKMIFTKTKTADRV